MKGTHTEFSVENLLRNINLEDREVDGWITLNVSQGNRL
jgi:hypothetical protein